MNQNNFYKLKYSKYKNKYIELKKNSNQEGGFRDDTAYFFSKYVFETFFTIEYDTNSKPIIKNKRGNVLSESDIAGVSRIIIDDKQSTNNWKYKNFIFYTKTDPLNHQYLIYNDDYGMQPEH
jgi:hypothetical protein